MERSRRAGISGSWIGSLVSAGAAAALVWWAIDRGGAIRRNVDTKLEAAPLVGVWDWSPTWRIVPAIAVGVATLALSKKPMQRLRLRWLLAVVGGLAMLWTIALAWSQGSAAMIDPVTDRTEYWARLPKLPAAHEMLRVWADPMWMRNQPVHLKGHPPGYVLVLKVMSHIGLGSAWAAAALSWIASGVVAMCVVLAVRLGRPDDLWRRVCPFAVVAPYAVWMGTSADALFSAVGAVGVVLAITAVRGRSRFSVFGVLAGVAFGMGLMLSYGMATFLVIPGLVVLFGGRLGWQRRAIVGVAIAAGAAAVLGTFVLFGFWWLDGLNTTRFFYWKGTAQFRPWGYFFVANLANTVIAVGPAAVIGGGAVIGRLLARGRLLTTRLSLASVKPWLLSVGAVLALTAANVSQLSKGETERIWLPFFAFLTPLAAAIGRARRPSRILLCAQIICALVLQVSLRSKW